MAPAPRLCWLPSEPAFRKRLKQLAGLAPEEAWDEAVALANTGLDFVAMNALDQVIQRTFEAGPPAALATKPVRLAILGSSTLAHLHAAIRLAGVRRGLWITTDEND